MRTLSDVYFQPPETDGEAETGLVHIRHVLQQWLRTNEAYLMAGEESLAAPRATSGQHPRTAAAPYYWSGYASSSTPTAEPSVAGMV